MARQEERRDPERLDALARIDDGLDAVALHAFTEDPQEPPRIGNG